MGHKGWSSKVAGPAIGPYRQATEAGGFVFLSGQLALDEQGNLLNGSVAEQTRKALERAQSLLKEGRARCKPSQGRQGARLNTDN